MSSVEKKLKRELQEQLSSIQAELLARKINSEQASARIDRAKGRYERALAHARRDPRKWFRILWWTAAAVAALVAWRVVAWLEDPALQWPAGLAVAQVLVLGVVARRERSRLRRRARESFGPYAAALVLDRPLADQSCREVSGAMMAIELKNHHALVTTLDEDALAELHSVLLDELAARFEAAGAILMPTGYAVWLAVWTNAPGRDPGRLATETARALQSDLARKPALAAVNGRNAHLGIGIATGKARLGLLGNNGQQQLACLGRTVELARELAAAASWGEVLLSDELFTHLEGEVTVQPREPMRSLVSDSIVKIHAVVIPVESEA